MARPGRSIQFVTREGCTLCAEAHALLRGPARFMRIEIVEVDVDTDPDLHDTYGGRVPVVLAPDGTVLAEGRLAKRDAWRSVWTARRG